MTAATPSTVHVNDVDLSYIELGQGDPIVLVHGSLNDYRSWRGQLEPFSASHRVVAYSRRFHWPNAKPAEGDVVSASQNAADLAALIERLGLAPAHVVGSSYGAMTALTLAVARPELVRSLVLGEPPLLPWLARAPEGAALFESFMASAFGPAGEAFARGDDDAGIRAFIDGVIGPGAFDRLPEPAQAMMRDNAAVERIETVSPPERYFPELSTADVAGLRMPVLLLEGERSPKMFHLITDELARAAANAERVTIPAASHGMHGQNPAAYNQAVLDFIAAS